MWLYITQHREGIKFSGQYQIYDIINRFGIKYLHENTAQYYMNSFCVPFFSVGMTEGNFYGYGFVINSNQIEWKKNFEGNIW